VPPAMRKGSEDVNPCIPLSLDDGVAVGGCSGWWWAEGRVGKVILPKLVSRATMCGTQRCFTVKGDGSQRCSISTQGISVVIESLLELMQIPQDI